MHFDFFSSSSRYYFTIGICVCEFERTYPCMHMGCKVLIHFIPAKNGVHLNWLKWWRDHVAGLNVRNEIRTWFVTQYLVRRRWQCIVYQPSLCDCCAWMCTCTLYDTMMKKSNKCSGFDYNLHISTARNIKHQTISNDTKYKKTEH